MKLMVFTIFDSKNQSHCRPIMQPSSGGMLRSFADLANDKQHPIGQHPEDYALYRVGEWDDETGKMVHDEKDTSLGRALDFVVQPLENKK